MSKSSSRELRSAVASNDLPRAIELINAAVNVDKVSGFQENTVLHICANAGNNEIMVKLLNVCTCINQKNRDGDTALHLAVKEGHAGIVQLLLRHNININAINWKGNTALHVAIISLSEIESEVNKKQIYYLIIEILIDKQANIGIINNAGKTALEIAIENNLVKAVQIIVDGCMGTSTCWECSDNKHALFFVVLEGSIYIKKMVYEGDNMFREPLIERYQLKTTTLSEIETRITNVILISWLRNTNEKLCNGGNNNNALMFCFKKDLFNSIRFNFNGFSNKIVVKDLESASFFPTICDILLEKMILENNFTNIKTLVKLGYKININHLKMAIEKQDDEADHKKKYKIIRNLMRKVPYINHFIDNGIIGPNNSEILEIMQRHTDSFIYDASDEEEDFIFFRILQLFEKKEYFLNDNIYESVIAAERDFSKIRVNRKICPTALHVAARFPMANVQKLIETGYDVNSLNAFGETPLFLAADKKNAELLLKGGSRINHKNYAGETVFHSALRYLHHNTDTNDYFAFLMKHGSDLLDFYNTEKKCWTPLYQAIYMNKDDMAAELIRHGANCHSGRFHPHQSSVMLALEQKKSNLVDLMIKAGALPQCVPKVVSLHRLCLLSVRDQLKHKPCGIYNNLKLIQENFGDIYLPDAVIDMIMLNERFL